MVEQSVITFTGIIMAVLGGFVIVRVTYFSHNIQNLQGEVKQWYDQIYDIEYTTEFKKQPKELDPYKVMNILSKYFAVKNLKKDLDDYEIINKQAIKFDLIGIFIIIGMVGFFSINIIYENISNIFPSIRTLENFTQYMILILVALFRIYEWFAFWKLYSGKRKTVKNKDDANLN